MIFLHLTQVIMPPVKELAREGDFNPHTELNLPHLLQCKIQNPLVKGDNVKEDLECIIFYLF